MKVKLFDEAHELDLENKINKFLISNVELIDIKYSVSITTSGEDQIYCFSALVLYK